MLTFLHTTLFGHKPQQMGTAECNELVGGEIGADWERERQEVAVTERLTRNKQK